MSPTSPSSQPPSEEQPIRVSVEVNILDTPPGWGNIDISVHKKRTYDDVPVNRDRSPPRGPGNGRGSGRAWRSDNRRPRSRSRQRDYSYEKPRSRSPRDYSYDKNRGDHGLKFLNIFGFNDCRWISTISFPQIFPASH